MKKISLLLVLFIAAVTVNAQSVWVEYFDSATVGQDLEDYNSWYVSKKSADAMGVSPIIDEETLFYDDYVGSDTGKCVMLDSLMGQTDDTKRISTRVVEVMGDTLKPTVGSKMYAAFLVSVLPGSWTSFRDFVTWEGSSGSNWSRGRVFAKVSNERQDVTFAVSKNSSSSGNLEQAEMLLAGGIETHHLLVLTYEAVDGDANDVISLYVNPDPTKAEADQDAPLVAVDENSDYSETTYIKFNVRQRGVGARVGNIRVGTNWEFVLQGDPSVNVTSPKAVSNNSIYSYGNTIMTSASGFVQVYDLTGRKVMAQITNGMLETSLSNGIYIVRFEDNKGAVATSKVILK